MDRSSPTIELVKKNEVIVYIILALVFTWIFWIPLEFGNVTSSTLSFCLYNVGVLGPMFAALELTLLLKGWGGIRDHIAGILKWRTGIEWYLVAILIPLALETLLLFTVALSGKTLSINGSVVANGSIFLGQVYFSIATGIAFFGFLMPRILKSFSPLVSSLIMSVFFIVWDAPFVISNINIGRGDYEFWWVIGNLGIFFIFVWIFRNARGSIIPLIFLNLSLNYFRWFIKDVMQLSGLNDIYSLDFSLHALMGILILLANVKYFLGKAPVTAETSGSPTSG